MKDDIQLRPSFRSLHLFLQTHLDMDRIRENADGVRDDQVAKYFQLDFSFFVKFLSHLPIQAWIVQKLDDKYLMLGPL